MEKEISSYYQVMKLIVSKSYKMLFLIYKDMYILYTLGQKNHESELSKYNMRKSK